MLFTNNLHSSEAFTIMTHFANRDGKLSSLKDSVLLMLVPQFQQGVAAL